MFGGSDNNRDRFDRIVTAYGRKLLGYVARMTGDSASAEDIVQDVFIKLVRYWSDEFDPSPQMDAWLHRTARNLAIDHMRLERRRALLHERGAMEMDESAPPTPGQGAISGSEETERAAEALRNLTDRERELVVMKVYEDKSYKEMAELTGLSVGNVGFILHGAMKKLARFLNAERSR